MAEIVLLCTRTMGNIFEQVTSSVNNRLPYFNLQGIESCPKPFPQDLFDFNIKHTKVPQGTFKKISNLTPAGSTQQLILKLHQDCLYIDPSSGSTTIWYSKTRAEKYLKLLLGLKCKTSRLKEIEPLHSISVDL